MYLTPASVYFNTITLAQRLYTTARASLPLANPNYRQVIFTDAVTDGLPANIPRNTSQNVKITW